MTFLYVMYVVCIVASILLKLENDKLKKENEELKANGTIAQQVVDMLGIIMVFVYVDKEMG